MPCTRGDFEAPAKSSGDQRKLCVGVTPPTTASPARVTSLEVKMTLKQMLSFEVHKSAKCIKIFPRNGSWELLEKSLEVVGGGGFNRFRQGSGRAAAEPETSPCAS